MSKDERLPTLDSFVTALIGARVCAFTMAGAQLNGTLQAHDVRTGTCVAVACVIFDFNCIVSLFSFVRRQPWPCAAVCVCTDACNSPPLLRRHRAPPRRCCRIHLQDVEATPSDGSAVQRVSSVTLPRAELLALECAGDIDADRLLRAKANQEAAAAQRTQRSRRAEPREAQALPVHEPLTAPGVSVPRNEFVESSERI